MNNGILMWITPLDLSITSSSWSVKWWCTWIYHPKIGAANTSDDWITSNKKRRENHRPQKLNLPNNTNSTSKWIQWPKNRVVIQQRRVYRTGQCF